MAKKKTVSEQPKTAAEIGSQEETRQEQTEVKKSAKVVTTEGNTIDKIRIFQDESGATRVQVDYGKLKEGNTSAERRAFMHTLMSRPLTPEQGKVYQSLYAEDPNKAKEYAVRQAYPMHVDDKTYHNKNTTINGMKVDYINLEKLTAEKLDEKSKHLAGSWQLSFGQKGKLDTRFFGLLNTEEVSMIRNRAEVTLDEKGQIKSVGRPLTLADIAAAFHTRVKTEREAKEAKLKAVEKINWKELVSKNKLPEGVTVSNLRYINLPDKPDQVLLTGKANGIEVKGLLTPNETVAVRNKIIDLKQAAAVNRAFSDKVKALVAPVAAVSMEDAVKAIVDRASSPSAKAFTPEQVKVLNDYVSSVGTSDDRKGYFDGLWEVAEARLSGVNEAWKLDAHNELNDLADGIVREEQQSMKR